MGTAAELVLGRADDERPGLVFEGRTWSWASVVDEGRRRAGWMRARLDPGRPPHVGVLLDNTPDYVSLLAGAALTGTVIVGLNPTRRGEELARDVRHTDCQFVLTDAAGEELLAGSDLGGAALVPASEAVGSPVEGRQPEDGDLFVLIFTSGSTGHPKAVKVSHGRAFRSAAGVPFSPDDVLYSAMPLFHGNALFSNLLPAFRTGARVVLRRRFSASAFLEDVREHGCTFFNTVGRAIAHINATPPGAHDRDHRLKWVLGPETSEADKAAFSERFGVPVFDGYGSSENAVILHPTSNARHPGPLGVAPKGTDIAVVDPETGEECPRARFSADGELQNAAEAVGEIVGRDAAGRFEGYYNDPEAEAARRRGGWYWSGDLAYRDEDGVFYFAGRAGDWLRVDSENFTAAPIERILARAPGVAGVAVYPVPDPVTGDMVMAALEMAPGASFDAAEFAAWMAEQPDLGPKWVPSLIRLVAALPVTGVDKVDKKPLRAEAWRTVDPVWWRRPRSASFERLSSQDTEAFEEGLRRHGRAHFLP